MANQFNRTELLLGKEAVKINAEGGFARSVTFAVGSAVSADFIVIAADPAAMFGKIIDAPMPRVLAAQYNNPGYIRFSAQVLFAAVLPQRLPLTPTTSWQRSDHTDRLVKTMYIPTGNL